MNLKNIFKSLNHPNESETPFHHHMNWEEVKALYEYAITHPEKEKICFGLKFHKGNIGTQVKVVDVPFGEKGWYWSNRETDISDYGCW